MTFLTMQAPISKQPENPGKPLRSPSKTLLGGFFDLVSRVSKVGYGGFKLGFLRDAK